MSTATTPVAGERTFFGHPRGLETLFFTEMWERFSYYGMRALLVLYMTAPLTGDNPGLGIDDGVAKAIYGTYSGLVYLTPVAGGWIADRLIGLRRSVLYGGVVIACGHFLMAMPTELSFWLGLLAISLGTGLLKPNVSGIVGQLYAPEDAKRDAGFSLFYMGINIGSFAAPLICGTLGQGVGWHLGFGAAGVGMTLGILQYVLGRRYLHGVGDKPDEPATAQERKHVLVIAAVVVGILAVLITAFVIAGQSSVTAVTSAVTVFILIVPLWYFRQVLRGTSGDARGRSRVTAFIWLFLGAAIFWMIFEQSGSTLTLFAENVTNLAVTSGFSIPASWLQSVNPLFIVIFAPVFSAVWLRWGDRAPRTSVKFGVALLIVGFSFLLLTIPMSSYANTGHKATIWWLVTVYLLQTWGELLLSPNGLSATTKLAPHGALGQFLALWFLATSVGTTVGGQIARVTSNDPVLSFAVCGGMAVAFGAIMLSVVRKINALMGDVH
ncbi:peptide MFS transporter [Miniimonas arenae]|uniref:Peptide MFS transporter n=1 Tax=Miniimonas arenae TaxID=676201 RepID=A0A5C5B9R9_9MICO|nr:MULTISPECIES: peptide MFS transporter [Miniimonas]TNU73269.1 peptide MFS transporter [Miniimonas arenae]